jgi:hypothetical protein
MQSSHQLAPFCWWSIGTYFHLGDKSLLDMNCERQNTDQQSSASAA